MVLVGETVHRSRNSRSVFVAELLTFLGSKDFPYAPRYLGVDEHGRDVFTYIEGRTTSHPSERAPGSYAAGGRMLRALHDATAGHRLAGDEECVLHGDPGAFNTIFRDGMPIAFIDWDAVRPGRRIDDLGYMAWTWCIQAAGNVPIADQARHLRLLRDGYGDIDGGGLLDAIERAQTGIADQEHRVFNDHAQPVQRRQRAGEAVNWATSDRALVHANLGDFQAALAH